MLTRPNCLKYVIKQNKSWIILFIVVENEFRGNSGLNYYAYRYKSKGTKEGKNEKSVINVWSMCDQYVINV